MRAGWKISNLKNRSLIKIKGEDSLKFLQGLTTNNLLNLPKKPSIYTAFLNPKGRFLYDSIIYNNPLKEEHENYIIETSSTFGNMLYKYLGFYKLRSKVSLELVPEKELTVNQIFKVKNGNENDNIEIEREKDPRSPSLGYRFISPSSLLEEISSDLNKKYEIEQVDDKIYHNYRRLHGLIEGEELESEKTIILDVGLQDFNIISFNKGCYVGQELMSRVFHTGVIRKCICAAIYQPQPSFFLSPSSSPIVPYNQLQIEYLLSNNEYTLEKNSFAIPKDSKVVVKDESGKLTQIGSTIVAENNISLIATRKNELETLQNSNSSEVFIEANETLIPLVFVK